MEELKPKQTKPIINMSVGICSGAFVYAYYSVFVRVGQFAVCPKSSFLIRVRVPLSVATSLFNLGAFISPIAYKRFTNYFRELKGLLLIDILAILSNSLNLNSTTSQLAGSFQGCSWAYQPALSQST